MVPPCRILIYGFIWTGVYCSQQILWLPCHFTDEQVIMNNEGHRETQRIPRNAVLQFGQTGEAPVDLRTITFQVTGSKVDMRHYVEGVEAEQLECELRRYSTQGIYVHWPSQKAREYNHWFSVSLKHNQGLFTVLGFLRHPSDQPPPGKQDYLSWVPITDGQMLTTSVAMVMKTETPLVKTSLRSEQKLHCQFSVDHRGANTTVEWHWQRRGERTRLFSHTGRSRQGSGVALKALAGGDASYSLPFTKMSSEGTYVCSVQVNPLSASVDVNLLIEEPPRVSLNVGPTVTLQEGSDHKVICEAENYYPLDVDIEWHEQDPSPLGHRVGVPLPKVVPNILLSSHKQNQDMTFSMSAFFYLQPSPKASGRQFICSVSHKSLRMPIKKSFILIVKEPSSWLFPLTLSIILLTLLVLMLRHLHSARGRSKKVKS
uniref:Si:ch211-108p6.4 n=1 Tax=Nothobranchius furzeri TaxID=105023 RepID=A0A8C6NWV1_NOTFU